MDAPLPQPRAGLAAIGHYTLAGSTIATQTPCPAGRYGSTTVSAHTVDCPPPPPCHTTPHQASSCAGLVHVTVHGGVRRQLLLQRGRQRVHLLLRGQLLCRRPGDTLPGGSLRRHGGEWGPCGWRAIAVAAQPLSPPPPCAGNHAVHVHRQVVWGHDARGAARFPPCLHSVRAGPATAGYYTTAGSTIATRFGCTIGNYCPAVSGCGAVCTRPHPRSPPPAFLFLIACRALPR
jgi:hypothetical protein